ncbi:hypothetical protein [Nonomuraea maritima]|uniref:hypothetical protein n=1 Tax=Nonomuraea maritima TaxID=683260 RepID=UPI00370F99CB
MTAHSQPDRYDALSQQFLDSLDTVLDIDAGLREILLESQHSTLITGLDTVLDVDAGLAAIIPPAAGHHHLEPTQASSAEQHEFHVLVPAHIRLTLRSHPLIESEASLLHTIKSLAGRTRVHIDETRYLMGHPSRWNRSERLEAKLDELESLLNSVNSIATSMRTFIDGNRGWCTKVTEDFAALLQAQAALRKLYSEARGAMVAARQWSSSGWLEPELRFQLELPLRKAHRPMENLFRAAVSISLHRINDHIRVALGRFDLPDLDARALADFLDDFTRADLRNASLAGVDLRGVCWSTSTTSWPAHIDVEELKERSDKVPAKRGIYIIRSGTATVRGITERA